MISYIFSKKMRLLISDHFNLVFQQSKRFNISQIIILGRLNTLQHPRIGLAISKKYVKLSHERNRIKRLIRESFRLHQHILPTMDFVIIVKKNITNFNNHTLTKNLGKLWYQYYHH